jgi:hypothetical protein
MEEEEHIHWLCECFKVSQQLWVFWIDYYSNGISWSLRHFCYSLNELSAVTQLSDVEVGGEGVFYLTWFWLLSLRLN